MIEEWQNVFLLSAGILAFAVLVYAVFGSGGLRLTSLIVLRPCGHGPRGGLLTLKIDRATWPFLKIDMRHGAYRHGKTY